jgi:ABC-type multidrug transport system ATPase subunit
MKIELRSVLKSYRSMRALDQVSLEIEPGQILCLLGPNGAGKTTLLRCLAGIAAPDKGEVYFDDQEFRRDRLDLRSRIYFMPDFPFLFWEHSIVRNIAIILRLYEADGEGVETRVLELLRDFDLLPLAFPKRGLWRCWRRTGRCGCWTNRLRPAWIRRGSMRLSAMRVTRRAGDARFFIRRKFWT